MKIKILYIDTPINPPGGGQISLLLLLRHLNKDKFEPLVFIPHKCEFANVLEEENIACRIVPTRGLFLAIKKASSSIVHCNSATTQYAFRSALASKISRTPFIWHVRVVESAGWKDKVIASLSTKIIAISDAVNGKFPYVRSHKIIKIYNAVDTEAFKPQLNTEYLYKKLNISKDKKLVGIFSRLDHGKGHVLFFDTAKIVKDRIKDAKFLIVGDGDKKYKSYLMNYVEKLGIKNAVVFTGYRKDIPELMNLCDIVITSSTEPESFGRTIIEAMSCKRPVVSTDMGGPKEIIDNDTDGFLVSPEPEKIAEVIIRLLSDGDLHTRISINAIHKANSKFCIENHIQQIESLYTGLLKK